jgi:hypothetical protein
MLVYARKLPIPGSKWKFQLRHKLPIDAAFALEDVTLPPNHPQYQRCFSVRIFYVFSPSHFPNFF